MPEREVSTSDVRTRHYRYVDKTPDEGSKKREDIKIQARKEKMNGKVVESRVELTVGYLSRIREPITIEFYHEAVPRLIKALEDYIEWTKEENE